MPRILVTGASGFIGSCMAQQLAAEGHSVTGLDLRQAGFPIDWHCGEITDRAFVASVLRETQPEIIFHLAGLIKSPEAESLYKANLIGTVALFETLMDADMRPLVMVASSSAVYGRASGREPIAETAEIQPITHYAVSKVAQEIAALRYFNSYEFPVIVLRMFNLLGPGQSPALACSSFARQIALAEANGGGEISTGNLDAQRDFIDARDAVRAFILAAQKGSPGQVYNVCSGKATALQFCLDQMISMSTCRIEAKIDTERIQSNDLPIQIGNAEKIKQATGWSPQIPLEQSLADLLNDWRQKIKMEKQ
jgi:GDP-4-dehydro-6-deoxy-D-mannose reductase